MSPIISTNAVNDDSDEIIDASLSRLYSVFLMTVCFLIVFLFLMQRYRPLVPYLGTSGENF